MKIALLVEGATEKAFLPALRSYLTRTLAGKMPTLKAFPQGGRIPKEDKLKRLVENLLKDYDAVIALTDVYTNKDPNNRDFTDAADAKNKMRRWVGDNPKFYPHAAQYDFEAWLLPYWPALQTLAKHNRNSPSGRPETVNHDKSPAYHIAELFESGRSRSYNKERDAPKILAANDLAVSISQCSELKSLVNTILILCGSADLP